MTIEGMIDLSARLSARFGGATILASALLVTAEVISRNLGLGLKLHAFDLTNYAFASAIAFGFAYAASSRAHIRIDILYGKLPLALRAPLDSLAMSLLAIMAIGMAFHAWRVVAHSMKLGARPNSTLDIPIAAPQAIWALGLSWFALIAIALALQTLIYLRKGKLDDVQSRAGIMLEDNSEISR